jgi:hypothetical protein
VGLISSVSTLTGKVRYQEYRRAFGKPWFILQVEEFVILRITWIFKYEYKGFRWRNAEMKDFDFLNKLPISGRRCSGQASLLLQ